LEERVDGTGTGREHLPLTDGWVLATNHSKQAIASFIRQACDIAGVAFGSELVVHLG